MAFRALNVRAVVQDLERYGARTQRDVGLVMERSLDRVYNRQQQLVAVDTGRMKRLTRHELAANRRSYVMGLEGQDFADEGQPPYFVYVEFGTFKMVAQPSVLPAFFEEEPKLLSDLRRVYQ